MKVQKYWSIYQLSLPIANIEYRISSLYAFSVLSPDLHFLQRQKYSGILQFDHFHSPKHIFLLTPNCWRFSWWCFSGHCWILKPWFCCKAMWEDDTWHFLSANYNLLCIFKELIKTRQSLMMWDVSVLKYLSALFILEKSCNFYEPGD